MNNLKFINLLEAGVITGAVQTTLSLSYDLVRTRIIQDKQMLGKDIFTYKCARDLIKKRGLLSLYTGFTPAIASAPSCWTNVSKLSIFKKKDNILSQILL